ncbi:MAG: NAD(P)-dependent oxidoreductase [Oscillospiraceae bacterium]
MRELNTVGFVGLGHMGFGMASNLLKAGKKIIACDINKEVIANLPYQENVTSVDHAGDILKYTNTVITMLPNSPHVKTVIYGEGGLLSATAADLFIADMSSISPDVTKDIAADLESRGIKFVEGPVSGGVSGATNGTLTIMCAGKKELIDDIMPVFEIVGKNIIYCGPSGSGQAVKVVNQLMSAINLVSMSEAFTLGTKFGADPVIMRSVITKGSGRCWALEDRMPEILKGNFEPGFSIDLHTKDIKLAVDMAKNIKFPMPVANLVCELFEIAQVRGLGGKDNCAIIKLYEELAGIEIRSEN